MDQDMDALCACCAQPMRATTFPAVCSECRCDITVGRAEVIADLQTQAMQMLGGNAANRINRLTIAPDPWLAALTVGDAAFLHELKIDPLG